MPDKQTVDLESASEEVAPKRRRANTRSPARVTQKARAKAKSAPAKRRTRKPAKARAPRRTSKTKGRATAPKRTVRAKRISTRAKTK
ncbi:hypothetical protein [Melittangium boletus]|uniref:Uncharacterized protein n=1 Tax=Melittangium boletus DSM 14713 TaxID=1294270 RepID=A0A250IBN8_9BACT|nr:hypothetical protein [Melittangium boletus]ATB29274.1 hypothetical protein MEBOL_002723 [Melittangium boletus DSM 14713]